MSSHFRNNYSGYSISDWRVAFVHRFGFGVIFLKADGGFLWIASNSMIKRVHSFMDC